MQAKSAVRTSKPGMIPETSTRAVRAKVRRSERCCGYRDLIGRALSLWISVRTWWAPCLVSNDDWVQSSDSVQIRPEHKIWTGLASRRWNVPRTDQHLERILGLNLPRYGYILSFPDLGERLGSAVPISSDDRSSLHPFSVFPAPATQLPTCIFPVFNRWSGPIPPSTHGFRPRIPRLVSARPRPHFAFARDKNHNMRLSLSRTFLSARAAAAYHAPLCRVVPGHRRAAWRRVRSLPAAPLSIGSRQ